MVHQIYATDTVFTLRCGGGAYPDWLICNVSSAALQFAYYFGGDMDVNIFLSVQLDTMQVFFYCVLILWCAYTVKITF